MNKLSGKPEKQVNKKIFLKYLLSLVSLIFYILKQLKITVMKLSTRTLLKLKNKNKKLKPNKYKKLKRDSLRGNVKGTLDRPRLSVYRSNEHIYAQIIDDTNSKTLLACSTLDRSIKLNLSTGRTCDASRLMGEKLAELSLKKNVTKIVFDRGPYLYHGRIKALADGARAGGLQF
jgi:large subunit ribosomal protein L18